MKFAKRSGISAALVIIVIVVILIAAALTYFYIATTPTQPTVQVTYKDTIVIGTTDSVQTTIDPVDAYDYFGDNMINNLGAPLVDFPPGTTDTSPSALQPALATKWTVSQDGLTYTFTLRSGLKYDDGRPFTAADVKYHFDRGIKINDPEGPFVGIGYGDIIDRVDAPNATTVVFHLKQPFAPFLSLLTFAASYPVNPDRAPMDKIVNYTAGNPTASNPNGLGPYRLTEWVRSGNKDVEMKLEANPNYWNYPTYPKTKTIIIKFYPDATSLAAAIKAGDVDVAYRQFTSADIKSLQATPGLKVWPSPGAFIQYLVINQKIKPFDDVRVRQALAAAVNRTDLVNTVFLGTARPLYSQIPIGMFGHIDAFKKYGDANYALTRQLLAQLGYNEQNKLKVDLWYETSGHYPQSADQATVLKKDLEASGVITVNLHGTDWGTYGAQRRQGTMPVYILGWYPDFIDPYDYTYPFFQSSASSWLHMGYNSTQMDNLLSQALSTSDPNRAAQLYSQVQQLQADDVPIIPLYQGGANCCGAVAKSSVGGIFLDVTLIFRMYTIYETA